MSNDRLEVHVLAQWVASLPQLADDVRAAIGPLIPVQLTTPYLELRLQPAARHVN
jgi:hypothetical protein